MGPTKCKVARTLAEQQALQHGLSLSAEQRSSQQAPKHGRSMSARLKTTKHNGIWISSESRRTSALSKLSQTKPKVKCYDHYIHHMHVWSPPVSVTLMSSFSWSDSLLHTWQKALFVPLVLVFFSTHNHSDGSVQLGCDTAHPVWLLLLKFRSSCKHSPHCK